MFSNNVVFIRWKRHTLTKMNVNSSFFIAFIFLRLVPVFTNANYDWYVVTY